MSLDETKTTFRAMGLDNHLLKALDEVGYEFPTSIQAECIPHLLAGSDLVGQAQTGTGKTAAFSLPLLSRLDLARAVPQLLVLAPTRELAIQVCEAMQSYARHLPNFRIAPIYGGQSYDIQNRLLRRGVHVIVGTPGRVMDHIRRKTLQVDQLHALVLDEGDEMLRMGFIDDIEWVLEQIPKTGRQIALFSATMPPEIRKVAQRYLNNPVEITIRQKTTTAASIHQRYWEVSGVNKLDALTRILEVEEFEAVLIFVRTKNSTVELAEKLSARGFSADALNGDIPQQGRERIVDRLRRGTLEVLVATDVAARGLDVDKISLVVNYDIPYDTESYVHRVGRTGRAGRAGEAILFVAPRERRMLASIERATRQPIERMQLPTAKDINEQRVVRFKQQITEILDETDLSAFESLLQDFQAESSVDPIRIAAALAALTQGDEPLFLNESSDARMLANRDRDSRRFEERGGRSGRREKRPLRSKDIPDVKMERYQIEVGYHHGVKPGNIVGAIANEANLDSSYIGQIEISEQFTTVDLPAGMDAETLNILRNTRICGVPSRISPYAGEPVHRPDRAERPSRAERPAHSRAPRNEKSTHPRRRREPDSSASAPRKRRDSASFSAAAAPTAPKDAPRSKKHGKQKSSPKGNRDFEPVTDLIRSFSSPTGRGSKKKKS